MKRYNNLYTKIFSKDNLRLAHKNASKGKQHYKEVKYVNTNLESLIDELHNTLKTHSFTNSPYETFIKQDKAKQRTIYKLPYYPDRIVLHAILQVLEPIWKSTLITDTYQSIKGRGLHKAVKKIIKVIKREQYDYYLQIDVKQFYPSIDNNKLKVVIRNKIKCKDTLALLDNIIDSTKGVPIGNYISQYFGNLYLSELDHFIKEQLKIKAYFRYCDDLVLLHNDKQYLQVALQAITLKLVELNLEVKNGTKLLPLESGLDFLGIIFTKVNVSLRDSIVAAMSTAFYYNKSKALPSYYGWIKLTQLYILWVYFRRVNGL